MFDNNYLFPLTQACLTRLTSPSPLSLPIPPTIARAARTPTIACPTRTFQKNFLFTLTLYLPYTNDTGRAKEKRKISEV